MNEIDVRKLVDQGHKTAFVLGTIIGSMSTLLNNIKSGSLTEIPDIYNELRDIHRQAGMQIHEIYYKHLEEGFEHE